MKATPAAQLRLLDLAALDAKRARLQHTANHLPEQRSLRELSARRASVRAEHVRLAGVLEDRQAELRRIEADVEAVDRREARDRELLASSSSTKNIAGIEHELETLRRRRAELEDVQLEVMSRVEEDQAALQLAAAERARVEDEASELEGLRDAAVVNLKEDARVIAGERANILREIPADLVALYEQHRARRGVGAAELVGDVTSATGVTLDQTDLRWIRAAAPDEVIECPDSGVILVRTKRSGLTAGA